ncbi:hypothetical protein VTK73DRAFT_8747 [Phialemonium thermophilum]|uniref:Uncharacterized protein n=1 Tax=Phialemonium thermophilum TaxID=223376 RepID=A0ABR3W6H8_9PEZI
MALGYRRLSAWVSEEKLGCTLVAHVIHDWKPRGLDLPARNRISIRFVALHGLPRAGGTFLRSASSTFESPSHEPPVSYDSHDHRPSSTSVLRLCDPSVLTEWMGYPTGFLRLGASSRTRLRMAMDARPSFEEPANSRSESMGKLSSIRMGRLDVLLGGHCDSKRK